MLFRIVSVAPNAVAREVIILFQRVQAERQILAVSKGKFCTLRIPLSQIGQ